MTTERKVVINSKELVGYEIKLNTKYLVLILAPKGYLMCGYLNLDVADKFGDIAAIITGVSTVEEMLSKPIVKLTSNAEKLGIKIGMTGEEALKLLV